MWKDGYCPDEIKIYPTQLVAEAPLFDYWKRGEFQPYTTENLINLIADIKPGIPIYSRVNRIVRDIPANYIIAGSKRSSLRQDVHKELERRGERCRCIRCREIRGSAVDIKTLVYEDYMYRTTSAEEHFLNYHTQDDQLAGYLRLSFPDNIESTCAKNDLTALYQAIPELKDAALIREIHIYGQSLAVGAEQTGAAQHSGLGTQLLESAEDAARRAGYKKLTVIAAVGTRLYYEKRAFTRSGLYMHKDIL